MRLGQFYQIFTASGSWTAPSGLAFPPAVYVWGPAGTSGTGSSGISGAGAAGAGSLGGEPLLAGVSSSTVLTVTITAAGSGSPSTVTGGSVTVTGNQGSNASGTTGGAGGTAPSNTVSEAGGHGGNGTAGGAGGGGGGSAGSTGAGGTGGNASSPSANGAGGAAGTGPAGPPSLAGAVGGNGANNTTNAQNGTVPGSAGGGGSATSGHTAPGTGAGGQAIIIWSVWLPDGSVASHIPLRRIGSSKGSAGAPVQAVGPITPAKFIQPNIAIRGHKGKTGGTKGSVGAPVIFIPTFPSKFTQPGKAVRGRASATSGSDQGSVGAPVIPTPFGLVNTTIGSSYGIPGPVAVTPNNTKGNLLVLLAAWDVTAVETSGGPVVPVASVTDNARNWWRLAGDTGSAVPGCRAAAWVCSNARAVNRWLSCCVQGNFSSLWFVVLELYVPTSNYWPLIDFQVAASSKSATILNAGGTATVGDYCFSIGAASLSTDTITAPSSGWTAAASGSVGGANPNSLNVSTVFGTFAAGAVGATWNYASAQQVAALTIGITQSQNLPTQVNPNFPRVFVEAAFGVSPGDPTAAILDSAYTDISSYAIGPAGQVSISTTGGRAYELSQPEAGTITIGLNNQSGAFNPTNTASPFYPNVIPGVPVRVSAQFGGSRYPIRAGWVERWPQDWPDMPQWGWSKMIASDAVGVASSVNLPSAVQGEILADLPYLCLPFGEQYTSSSNSIGGATLTATDCFGLAANNTAPANQRTATYIDGLTEVVATGQSLGFLGDSGTGMGTTGYGSAISIVGGRGPGALYGPDTNLPALVPAGAGDVALECWFTFPVLTAPAATENIQLLQLVCQPFLASNVPAGGNWSNGMLVSVGLQVLSTGVSNLYIESNETAGDTSGGFCAMGVLHHLMVGLQNGQITVWLDGALVATVSSAVSTTAQPIGVTFGQAVYSFGLSHANADYTMAYGVLYGYLPSITRAAAHYQSGINGFSGDTMIQRAARYAAWARLNLGLGGPAGLPADHVGLSSAYSTAATPMSSALNADAVSSGGSWLANASGNLLVLPRPGNYDLPTQITFGDNPAAGEVPYDPASAFDFDNTYISNVVQATLTQGPNTLLSPVVRNAASSAKYFQRGPLQQQVSTASMGDAIDRANWSSGKYAQPSLRVRTLVTNLASHPATIPQVLATDLGDPAVVNRRPLTQGSYSVPVTVGKIQHDIGPGIWKTTWQLYPYVPEDAILEADTTTYNVLGNNALAW